MGNRVTVLVISVLCGGTAVPVAWKALSGNVPGEWNPYWKTLIGAVAYGLACDIPVVVLADRGLTGAWLFREIVRYRWHPLIRIKRTGPFRFHQTDTWRSIASFALRPGCQWKGANGREKETLSRKPRLACGRR
ncbi:hypothetical protein FJZ36_03860 [Candidatus Poribacteria bacterium]|nr:hypothetical protein [Candidatus Poribacteria bacterium]